MTKLRPYRDSDNETITAMLTAEGIEQDRMRHKHFETHVLENGEILGFFTIREERGVPSLQHFCIKKKYRSNKNARLLAKFFKAVVMRKGSLFAIVHAVRNKPCLKRLIEFYFKAKPYAETENKFWYLVKVI